MTQTVEMELDKETKGAVRYAEKGDPAGQILRTVYIRKSAFKEGTAFPKEIQVTVESLQ
jgi:hypothetical protein